MRFVKTYLLPRLAQYIFVVVVGVTAVFIIPRLTPIDPVQQQIATMTAQGSRDPAAIERLQESLRDLYGLKGSLFSQYISLWKRLFTGDFGVSFSQFPTPAMELIMNSLPWTIGLMGTAMALSWTLGTILGGLISYFRTSGWAKALEKLVMVLRPIPYYVLALMILLLFCYLLPLFPIAGGFEAGREIGWNWSFLVDILKHSFLPALSLIVLTTAIAAQTMRLICSNLVEEDYVKYAQVGGLKDRTIASKYVIRNGLLPQTTNLTLALGQVFGGTVITEIVFAYPGLGYLLFQAITSADYNVIIGVITLSVVAIATGALILDLIYPLVDPRVRYK